jgi:Methyltransferase domain
VTRLNWGCGAHVAPGWINSDVKTGEGVDLAADIRQGLPLASESIDYAVSIHALPEFAYGELASVLEELRRVLKRGGVLRLGLPDLLRGIDAFQRGDFEYFRVDPAEVRSPGGRFIVHMLWYGYSRTLFTPDFAEELLGKAGFVDVRECAFGHTASPFPEIVELDNREDESFFIEARRRRARDPRTPYNPDVVEEPNVKVLDIVHATPNEGVRGHFRVEQGADALDVVGWVLGEKRSVVAIEIVAGGEVVASTSPVLERPDIAEAFPDAKGADTCGFQLAIEPSGKGESHLDVRATLDDGSQVPIGELEVASSRGRRKGFLRRFG